MRTQEKHITRLDIALKNATAKEEQLLTQIDQMERDKRSKSWHILKEIHQELRQDIGTSDSSSVRRAPQQPGSFEAISSPTSTLPGRFPLPSMPSVPNTSNSATSTLSAELNLTKATTPLSPVEAPHDSGDLLDISAVNMTAPTPPPVPRPVPNSHAAMTTTTTTTTTRNTASSSASNIVNTSRGVSHTSVANETFDEDVAGAATAADQSSGGGYSMYDSYELFSPANAMTTAQTPERGDKHGAFATERTIDSISKSEIFSSPADISWDQNDSFNARFTGTDKGIHHHQSAHVHYDVRRSGDSHHSHSQSHIYPSSDVSLGSRDDFGGGLLSATHPPSTNTSHVDYSQFDATLRRGQSALGAHSTPTWLPTGRRSGGEIDTNSTWLDRQTLGQGQKQSVGQLLPSSTSNGNPARRAVEERHAEEVQAIYSDIGRLSGRLESRLNKSASPEDVLRAYSYGTVGGGGGGPYGYSRSGQHK